MSRLTADGWFERSRLGRNSFYRLVKEGRQTFETATRHIYDPPPSEWTGRFELLLIGNGEDRDASREALKNAGYKGGKTGAARNLLWPASLGALAAAGLVLATGLVLQRPLARVPENSLKFVVGAMPLLLCDRCDFD